MFVTKLSLQSCLVMTQSTCIQVPQSSNLYWFISPYAKENYIVFRYLLHFSNDTVTCLLLHLVESKFLYYVNIFIKSSTSKEYFIYKNNPRWFFDGSWRKDNWGQVFYKFLELIDFQFATPAGDVLQNMAWIAAAARFPGLTCLQLHRFCSIRVESECQEIWRIGDWRWIYVSGKCETYVGFCWYWPKEKGKYTVYDQITSW